MILYDITYTFYGGFGAIKWLNFALLTLYTLWHASQNLLFSVLLMNMHLKSICSGFRLDIYCDAFLPRSLSAITFSLQRHWKKSSNAEQWRLIEVDGYIAEWKTLQRVAAGFSNRTRNGHLQAYAMKHSIILVKQRLRLTNSLCKYVHSSGLFAETYSP